SPPPPPHTTLFPYTTLFRSALTKQLLPEICANRGQVVFVNSSVVNHPAPGTVTYAATKHALKGLADGLRQEVNAFGVRVISVFRSEEHTSELQSRSDLLCRL